MRRPSGENAPFWPAARRLHAASPAFAQVKGEDQPQSLEAAEILNCFLVQPVLKFQSGQGKIPASRALDDGALMGSIYAAGIRRSNNAEGAIGKVRLVTHVDDRFQNYFRLIFNNSGTEAAEGYRGSACRRDHPVPERPNPIRSRP